MSTGCGPDKWARNKNQFKRWLDRWWDSGACAEHDFDSWRGGPESEFISSAFRWFRNAVRAVPLSLPAAAAGLLILLTEGRKHWNWTSEPKDRDDLLLLIFGDKYE